MIHAFRITGKLPVVLDANIVIAIQSVPIVNSVIRWVFFYHLLVSYADKVNSCVGED